MNMIVARHLVLLLSEEIVVRHLVLLPSAHFVFLSPFFNKAKTSHKSGASDTEESGYIFTKSKPIPSLFSFSFSFGFDFLSLSSLIFSHSLFFDIGPRKDIGKK